MNIEWRPEEVSDDLVRLGNSLGDPALDLVILATSRSA